MRIVLDHSCLHIIILGTNNFHPFINNKKRLITSQLDNDVTVLIYCSLIGRSPERSSQSAALLFPYQFSGHVKVHGTNLGKFRDLVPSRQLQYIISSPSYLVIIFILYCDSVHVINTLRANKRHEQTHSCLSGCHGYIFSNGGCSYSPRSQVGGADCVARK